MVACLGCLSQVHHLFHIFFFSVHHHDTLKYHTLPVAVVCLLCKKKNIKQLLSTLLYRITCFKTFKLNNQKKHNETYKKITWNMIFYFLILVHCTYRVSAFRVFWLDGWLSSPFVYKLQMPFLVFYCRKKKEKDRGWSFYISFALYLSFDTIRDSNLGLMSLYLSYLVDLGWPINEQLKTCLSFDDMAD